MKKQDLINAADELNSLLFEKPEIKTNVGPAETKGQIYEALKLLQPGDTLSKKTVSTILECDFEFDEKWLRGVEDSKELVSVLETLGIWLNMEEEEEIEEKTKETEEEPEEEPEEAEVVEEETLEEQVKTAPTLKDLKIVAKTNDEFKSIRGQLTKYNDIDPLVEDMLKMLNPPEKVKPEKDLKSQIKEADSLKELRSLLINDVFEQHVNELGSIKLTRMLKDSMVCVAETGVMPVKKKEEEKSEPKEEKKAAKTKKEKGTPSRKLLVYQAWKDGEEDVTKLHKLSPEITEIKVTTIKMWIKSWKKGIKLPKGS